MSATKKTKSASKKTVLKEIKNIKKPIITKATKKPNASKKTKVVSSQKSNKKVMKNRNLSSARLRKKLNMDMHGYELLDDIKYVHEHIDITKVDNTTVYSVSKKLDVKDADRKNRFKDLVTAYNNDMSKKVKDGEVYELVKLSDPLGMIRVLRAQKYRFNSSGMNTLNAAVFNMVSGLIQNGIVHTLKSSQKTVSVETLIKDIEDKEFYPYVCTLNTYVSVLNNLKNRDVEVAENKEKMRAYNKELKKYKSEKAKAKFQAEHQPEKHGVTSVFELSTGNDFALYGRLAWEDLKLSNAEYSDLRMSKKCAYFAGELVSEFLTKFARMIKVPLTRLFKNKKTINTSLVKTVLDIVCTYNDVQCNTSTDADVEKSGVSIKSMCAPKVEVEVEVETPKKSKKSKKVSKKKKPVKVEEDYMESGDDSD